MVQESVSGLFLEAMNQIGKEVISLLPKIILALIILAIAIIIIRLLNGFFGKILKIVKLDEMLSKIVQFPFSLSSLIIMLIDVGIFLIALFMIAELFLDPKQTQLMTEIFGYAGRIFSIIGVTIFAFIMFNILINRMVIETRIYCAYTSDSFDCDGNRSYISKSINKKFACSGYVNRIRYSNWSLRYMVFLP